MTIVCPFAIWRPLPEAMNQPIINPRAVILHTMVGSLQGTEAHFRERTGIESHFGVGGPTDGPELDGVIWQWMDLSRQADANLNANGFAISIETSDGGEPNRPWSMQQQEAIVRLGKWLAKRFGIPLRIIPSPTSSGFGWHVMFGAPGPWTPVAKTCPGAVRITQLENIVLPAIFSEPTLEPKGEEMLYLLRCDKVGDLPPRVPRLFNAATGWEQELTTDEMRALQAAGVKTLLLSGEPNAYDKAREALTRTLP